MNSGRRPSYVQLPVHCGARRLINCRPLFFYIPVRLVADSILPVVNLNYAPELFLLPTAGLLFRPPPALTILSPGEKGLTARVHVSISIPSFFGICPINL